MCVQACEEKLAQAEQEKQLALERGKIDLDEGPDAPPISAQIAMALRKNSARVLELFRAWDEDGSGAVDRAEFHVAMKKMGLDVPKKDIDNLFSEWDKGGDGSLGLRELQKILSKGGMSSAATTPKDAKDGKDAKASCGPANGGASPRPHREAQGVGGGEGRAEKGPRSGG